MSKLGDKLRASRESWESVGEYQFCIRRPTGLQVAQWAGISRVDIIPRVVVGWRRADGSPIQEIDIIPSGDPHPVAYDADVLMEWIGDESDLFVDLVDKIDKAILRSAEANEEAEKNSPSS